MPTLIWRSAYSYLPAIADGGTMDSCYVGEIEVGRVQRIGKAGSWICWLPSRKGPSVVYWHPERNWLAARAALAGHVTETLTSMGFDAAPQRPPVASPAPQPTFQQEMPL